VPGALVAGTAIGDAIRTYEKTLHPRSEEWASAAENGAEDLISGDGPPKPTRPTHPTAELTMPPGTHGPGRRGGAMCW
jgi:hypothetical protein